MSVFHCGFDLDYLIHRGGAREMANSGVRSDGRLLNESDILTRAVVLKARGYMLLPTCDSYDARGYCRGHDGSIPELGI